MIGILADDLTSALDGAAPFAQRGLSARVVLHEGALARYEADVLAIDLDTRFVEPAEAENRFLRAAEQIRTASLLYKTVDSTLRGNLGAETYGSLKGSQRKHAVVAPAFPAAGRTTVGGYQLVDGVPVERTAFASDPRTPVVSSRVAGRFAELALCLFTVHDASNDGALDQLIARIGLDSDVLWVGSPGLGAALARAVEVTASVQPAVITPRANRVLVVIGSLHPANRQQLEELVRGGAGLVSVAAVDELDVDETVHEIERAFAVHSVVCLVSPREVTPHRGASLAPVIGTIVKHCEHHFDGLIATGGDTARRIVDTLGAATIELRGEVEPGVPFGLLTAPGRSIPFSTKAGGFGGAGTLLRCVARLLSTTD